MTGRLLKLLLAFFALACNGPVAVFPGGSLEGEVQPLPADWRSIGEYGKAQLETRPADPYSVNLVYTVVGGEVFINAGDTETNWAAHIGENPNVRLRIAGLIYEMRAERVNSRAEIAEFARAWTSQSMFRRDPSRFDSAWIYRLAPR